MTHPQCDQIKKTRPKSHRTHLLSYSVLYFLLKNDSILKQSAHSWDNIMITTFRQWALIFAKTSRIFVENILKKQNIVSWSQSYDQQLLHQGCKKLPHEQIA
jgi:hypothetical protein